MRISVNQTVELLLPDTWRCRKNSRRPILFFALICGLALIASQQLDVLFPDVRSVSDDWRRRAATHCGVVVIVGIVALRMWGWSFYWTSRRAQNNMVGWMVDSPFQYFSNAIGCGALQPSSWFSHRFLW
jgi:hypothetical protein